MTTLAHGGGIPETLMVVVPMALTVVLFRMGAKRVPPAEEEPPAEAGEDQQST